MNDKVRVCPYCGEEVQALGEDAIDYCIDCGVCTEGETKAMP
jgi:hypothetical protein